jgi:hypothetical protein
MSLQISRKIILIILISTSLFLTVYTASAYYVASHISEAYGKLWWPNTVVGTFYPWPNVPTGIAGQMVTEIVDQINIQYYNYIIKSGILIVLTLLMWFITLLNLRKYSQHNNTHINKHAQ